MIVHDMQEEELMMTELKMSEKIAFFNRRGSTPVFPKFVAKQDPDRKTSPSNQLIST
jgi:hypothetical protein